MTTDIYMDAYLNQLPDGVRVLGRDIVALGDYQAGRLVLDSKAPGLVGKDLVYLVRNGDTMWVITYVTAAEEFDQRLPVFEQSARTFAIQP